jgi:protein-S-isoprenylcysteine O-methyltransferase Ste14
MDTVALKWIIFLAASAGMMYVSRGSLADRSTHGFPRIFAWEGGFALLLLNSGEWFADPFSPRQVVSWILLFGSIPPLVFGTVHLLSRGKPSKSRVDPALMDFEKTSELVTTGMYRYIRHPLYGSIILVAWGAFLKDISWLTSVLVAVTTLAAFLTARADERECIRYFGPKYTEYMKNSKMFIPHLF